MIVVEDQGSDNQVYISESAQQSANIRILLRGSRNLIRVGNRVQAANAYIDLGSDCVFDVGEECILGNLFAYGVAGAKIRIGHHVGFNGQVRLLAHENASITIGEWSLFGSEIDVSISDMHAIFDEASGQRINPAADVVVGDRVWIGQRAMLLKGAKIGAWSVIGAASVVTGDIPAHCIAAGVPARVVRGGITWDRRLLDRAPSWIDE